MTAYFGAVGSDAYAEQMKTQATKDGVNVQYMTVSFMRLFVKKKIKCFKNDFPIELFIPFL